MDQLMRSPLKCCQTSGCVKIFLIILTANLNVFTLFEIQGYFEAVSADASQREDSPGGVASFTLKLGKGGGGGK